MQWAAFKQRKLALLLGTLVGLAMGLGAYTFWYGKGFSYLGHDSAACANCHIMQDQYDGWTKASHRSVAECNDCHTPPGLIPKYSVKALNGFMHSFAFTTGYFHEPIRIKSLNRTVTESACRKCHSDIVNQVDSGQAHKQPLDCIQCHRSVGHLH